MSFEQVIGQDTAVSLLKEALNKGKRGMSWIFYGPKGTGKSFTALQFAKSLNCENQTPGGVAGGCCDICPSCLRAEKLSYPDLHWLDYEAESQTIKIDQVRSIQNAAGLRPFEGRVKVFVVNNCQDLSEEAGNSLLKIVEEPPLDTVIILIAESLASVLPTIVSRCRKIKFSNISRTELAGILREKGADEKLSAYLASSACGRIGQAISELPGRPLEQRDAILLKAINSVKSEDILKDKKEAHKALMVIMQWQRDILMLKLGLPEDSLINRDRLVELRQSAEMNSYSSLISAIDAVTETFEYLSRNLNTRLLSDNLQVSLALRKV